MDPEVTPSDTFTVTAYNKATQTATVTVKLLPRDGYAGETLTGVKVQLIPIDSVQSIKTFFRNYADAYIRGKQEEEAKKVEVSAEVVALLNKETNF
jgi:hypothetical protein